MRTEFATTSSSKARVSVDTQGAASARVPWLAGLRVGVQGESPAVRNAAKVLNQLGARVDQAGAGSGELSAGDFQGYDIVMIDRISSAPAAGKGQDSTASAYGEFVSDANTGVWVTASVFGLADERRDVLGSELTVLAAGGILGHSPGVEQDPPTVPAGDIGLKMVGNVMAMAALHGLHECRATGKPVHVDLSAQAALISTGLALEMGHALAECPEAGGSARYGAPTGFFPCTDGSVYILVLEEHQWSGFKGTLGKVLDGIDTLEDARLAADQVNEATAGWTSSRTTEECERVLQQAGVPCTVVNTVEEFIERSSRSGRPFDPTGPRAAAIPARLSSVSGLNAERKRAATGALSDLRVLDAGHVLAVPLAAAWLGAMGAEVIKLEDPERLDIYRRRGPFADGVAGVNRSGYFNHLNFCKESLDVHVDTEGSDLDAEPYDVVMTNLSPHRARLLGVDAGSVAATSRPTMHLASSGFGLTGERAKYRAYGTTIHAFAGLIAATRNARGEMSGVGTPWADPLSSVVIATWVLAWSLTSERADDIAVDISMTEIMATHLTDLIGKDADDTYAGSADGGDVFLRVPGEQHFVAVTLRDVTERETFKRVTGVPFPDSLRRGGEIDHSGGPLAGLGGAELESELQAAGLRACLTYTANDLARDARLYANEVFQIVESRTLGDYAITGLPWTFAGRSKARLTAAPERPLS